MSVDLPVVLDILSTSVDGTTQWRIDATVACVAGEPRSTVSASAAGSGVIMVNSGSTLTLRCAVNPTDSTGKTASVNQARLTVLQVETVH